MGCIKSRAPCDVDLFHIDLNAMEYREVQGSASAPRLG